MRFTLIYFDSMLLKLLENVTNEFSQVKVPFGFTLVTFKHTNPIKIFIFVSYKNILKV